MTNGNKASRLSYLTGLLTKLPGEHIPLLQSSCLVSKPVAEAFVIVQALTNPATADPIRRRLCSPLWLIMAKRSITSSLGARAHYTNLGSCTTETLYLPNAPLHLLET